MPGPLRDREFLSDPSSWPFQLGDGVAAAALKMTDPTTGKHRPATVLSTPDGALHLVPDVIPHAFLADPKAHDEPRRVTLTTLLAEGWLVD